MGSEWTLERLAGRMLSGFSWLRIGAAMGCCECGDEPSGSGTTELVSFIEHYFAVTIDFRGLTY
jgi:hypothetical protein